MGVDGVKEAREGGRVVRRKDWKAVGVCYRSPEGGEEETEGAEGLLA